MVTNDEFKLGEEGREGIKWESDFETDYGRFILGNNKVKSEWLRTCRSQDLWGREYQGRERHGVEYVSLHNLEIKI